MRILLMCLMVLVVVGCAVGQPSPGDQHQNPYAQEPAPIQAVPSCTTERVPMDWTSSDGSVHLCRNALRTVCDGQFVSQTPMVPAANEGLIGQTCDTAGNVWECVVNIDQTATVQCACGYTCTADGWYVNTCTGWQGSCLDSVANCATPPLVCQDAGPPSTECVVDWPAGAVTHYGCVAGSTWTWTDNSTTPASYPSCDTKPCPSGSACQLQVAPGGVPQTLTGICL